MTGHALKLDENGLNVIRLGRKWQRIITANKVYCSSTTHYEVDVWLFDKDNGRIYRNYLINAHSFISRNAAYLDTPRYVWEEINRQLHGKLTSGKLVVFENDRDGRERTENLRYHDPDYLARLIAPKEQTS